MTITRIALFTLCLAILPAITAKAQDSCGQTITMSNVGDMSETVGHCTVYDRQLAYREERLKFRALIEERREAYIAPQIAAEKNYKAKLEALNASRSAENDITSK